MTALPLFHVDAFTDSAFGGNPAVICLVASDTVKLTTEVMQKIGAEMNLSETAFIFGNNSVDFKTGDKFGLRWFTPLTEVNLCGHATLAAASVLINNIGNESKEIYFDTLSGTLTVRRQNELISMDFPLNPPEKQDSDEVKDLLNVVIRSDWIREVKYSPTTKKLLVLLADSVSRSDLESLKPAISRMVESEVTGKVKGVIVTVKGDQSKGAVDSQGRVYDFISRYFAPWVGIPEDPVTGSAHTVLAGYWSKELNKNELYARQCSARGGDVHVKVEGSRVHLSGQAAIIVEGTLRI